MFEDIKQLIPEILPFTAPSGNFKNSIEADAAFNRQQMYQFKKIEKIRDAIDIVANFNLETDKITATEYKNLKQTLNGLNFSGFHQYLDTLQGYTNYAELFKRFPTLENISWELPTELYRITASKISKFKKMKNLNGIEQDAVNYVVKRLETFLPLAEKVLAMKDCVGKKEVETKKQKIAKQVEQIRGNLDEKLKSALEEMAEFFRKKVEKSRVDFYTKRLENFDANKVKRYSDVEDIYDFLVPRSDDYRLKDNAFELIPEKAKKDSDEIIQDFIYKMMLKLGGLVVNFPNVEVSYDGTNRRNWISFKLSPDTYFMVENNIVTGVSKYGVWFNRYPTTFHNVVINGEKVNTPSELKVKKLLNVK